LRPYEKERSKCMRLIQPTSMPRTHLFPRCWASTLRRSRPIPLLGYRKLDDRRRIIKVSRDRPDSAWGGNVARAIQVSLIGSRLRARSSTLPIGTSCTTKSLILMATYQMVRPVERTSGQDALEPSRTSRSADCLKTSRCLPRPGIASGMRGGCLCAGVRGAFRAPAFARAWRGFRGLFGRSRRRRFPGRSRGLPLDLYIIKRRPAPYERVGVRRSRQAFFEPFPCFSELACLLCN